MNYDFEVEIKALEKSNIENKEKMFYIYIYFYLEFTDLLRLWKNYCPDINDKFISETQKYLAMVFEKAIEYFNLMHGIKDYKDILKQYFDYVYEQLECSLRKFNLLEYFYDMTKYFSNGCNLDLKHFSRDYSRDQFVPRYSNEVIDLVLCNLKSTDLNFRAKAISILNIKYHIDEILCQNYTYGVLRKSYTGLQRILNDYTDVFTPDLLIEPYDIASKLIDSIPTMVTNNKPISYEMLKEKTYQFLVEKIRISASADLIRNKEVLKFFCSLDENNKKLFWQVLICFLSGYPYDYEAKKIAWKNPIKKVRTRMRIRRITQRLWDSQYDITGKFHSEYYN